MIVHFVRFFKSFPKRGVKMPRAAVICEFNPFHNGHKFLLEKIKSTYANEIICVMSGHFVQRGDIAITDKYARTKTALRYGADMVVELPTVYAMASAKTFAENGVRLVSELSCDRLCFGSENSLKELYSAIDRLDSPDTQRMIAENMKRGDYYPKAVSDALGQPYGEIIKKPNNILAVEYIRACKCYGIEPIAIPREGVAHDDVRTGGNIASASHIRELITTGEPYHAYTPMTVENPATLVAVESAVLYRLKSTTREELAKLPDVGEGLENRIFEVAAQYNSFSEICEQIKTKRYTMARVRRILLSALLDITKEMQATPVPYVRVLGVRKERSALLKAGTLPLIIDVRRAYDLLDNSAKEIFEIDLKATSLMNIAENTGLNEFSHGIIKQ